MTLPIETLRLKDRMTYPDDNLSFCNMRGHVTIKDENGHVLVDKDNHIVKSGRRWLMQRMFDLSITKDSNEKDYLPGWFSIGNGGAALDTPFNNIWPTDDDVGLYNPLKFDADTEHNDSSVSLISENRYFKRITTTSFPSDLTAKITMEIDYKDFAGEYFNEAGMFLSYTDEKTNETSYLMFSHVTFPTMPKSQYQKLLVEWYFIF